jgi:FMN phosphatase YigB (HAD superfamily)
LLKGILFDLDDTLIDWSGFKSDWSALHRPHLNGVFDYICAEIHPLDDLDAYCVEFRNRTTAAWQASRDTLRAPNLGRVLLETTTAFGVPAEALDLQRCLEAYRWGALPGIVTFPEVPEVLALLTEHGIRVGIVTNAYEPMWMRDLEIRELGLSEFFPSCRVSAADVGYLKPHRVIFQTALDCLGTLPEETIFIGDDPQADVVGAQGIGMRAILRRNRRRDEPPNYAIVPNAVIDSFAELPPILDRWFAGWRG